MSHPHPSTQDTKFIGGHVRALSEAFQLEHSLVVPLRWEGVSALVFGALVRAEHHRRQRLGIGALRDYRTLAVSHEEPVGLTAGLLDPSAYVLRPPVLVDAVVVSGRCPQATIRRATYFAPIARRIAVLSTRPRHLDDPQVRAMWFEVGLAILDPSGEIEIVAEPGAEQVYDDIYLWWFAEAVYQAHLDVASEAPARATEPLTEADLRDRAHAPHRRPR